MKKGKKVSFVICAYNNHGIISKCLSSIRKQTSRDYEAIVVDDCSKDSTVQLIKREFPWVKVIVKDSQSGPSISRNIGIKHSSGELIATLDSDVVLERNWLKNQIKMMESDNRIAVSGSKLLYYGDRKKINSAGGSMTRLTIGKDRGSGESCRKYNKVEDLLFVCSAAMMIRKSVLNKIGAFDGSFFYGHEDTDLCWRANIAGYRVIYNPDAIAYHMLNETIRNMTERVAFHATKNRVISIIKNYNVLNMVIYLFSYSIASLGDIIFRRHRIAKIKAWIWCIINICHIFDERIKIQSIRNVPDSYLFRLFSKGLW